MKRIMIVIAAFAAASAVQAADDAKAKQAQAAQKERVAQCTRGADERKMKGERRAGYIQQCASRSAAAGASAAKTDSKGRQRGGELSHPDINKNVPNSGG